MIPESFIQQLKQYSDMESIVSTYVHLTKKGKTSVGLCPFHSEKTPSFYVYPDNQSYYCFGCGAGGDIINFVRKTENLEYMEALRFLAQRAGVSLPESDIDDAASRLKTRVLEINRETARYYHNCLIAPGGAKAYQYLVDRGRTPGIIRHFGLGYSPDSWDGTIDYLKAKGFTEAELVAAGVAAKSQKGAYYDRFRGRVIFPIIDLRGGVIGFGGRALEDRGPKYLNSAETVVFKKSRNLYALNFAKTSKASGLILAEGYMDVIALHQAGFDNAVATLGTSLTEGQARLISQYAEKVVIAYDADSAGQNATKRAINIFSDVGVKVSILTMTGAKDPDEFIKTFGAQRFRLLLEGCSNALEFEIAKIRGKYDLETPDGKVSFLKEFCNLLSGIKNPVEREVYLSQISQELLVSPSALQAQLDSIGKTKARVEKKKERGDLSLYVGNLAAGKNDLQRKQNLRAAMAEEGILYCLMKNPDFLPKLEAGLGAAYFVTDQNREIYTVLSERIYNNRSIDMMNLSEALSQEAMARLSGIMACAPSQRSDDRELSDYILILTEQKTVKTEKEVAEMDGEQLQDYIKSLAAKKK